MKSFRKLLTMMKQGFKGAWKHKSMGLASIISIVATLLVLGIMLISTITANGFAKEIRQKVDQVEIYLSRTIAPEDQQALEEKIKSSSVVQAYLYRSSKDAMDLMKASWGEDAYILEGIEDENQVLEASFVIKLNDIDQASDFVESMRSEKGVRDVTYYQDLVQQISNISSMIRVLGGAMVGILVLVSLFIILNTVKLTVVSRRREISVMKYVGATNHMIRGPFILEGMIFGLLGSLIAFGIVYGAYSFLYERFAARLYDLLSAYLITPGQLQQDLLRIFLGLGVGIGMIGSAFSVGRYVRIR
uniref:permease-like cell division protein FtsX n=1 Tax=Ndongobacter massiliensis TaxID=1871025 RepID=UPI0009314315|nr:permease-like cell division protein FtsX [Ndongobacter massiliensis]